MLGLLTHLLVLGQTLLGLRELVTLGLGGHNIIVLGGHGDGVEGVLCLDTRRMWCQVGWDGYDPRGDEYGTRQAESTTDI